MFAVTAIFSSSNHDMQLLKRFLYTLLFTFFLLMQNSLFAQVAVRGTIYDINNRPLPSVSVLSSSGKGTYTDSNGRYIIMLQPEDSVWFSYLNKPTIKYPVRSINPVLTFDLALHVNVVQLREVSVKEKNYKLDSIRNREDYARIFNYEKPNPLRNINVSNGGVGFDLDAIIGMFQFRKIKRMESFQKRLIQQEQDHYIDYRFNRRLVKQLTGLDSTYLDTFLVRYRPDYEFTLNSSEYDFRDYIIRAGRIYKYMLEMKKED